MRIETFFSQQVGVEAQVVDAEVQPSLSRDFALPVAAGVIVDQLLLVWHPKQLPELGPGLLELVRVVVLFDVVVLVVLRDDPLWRAQTDGRGGSGPSRNSAWLVFLTSLTCTFPFTNVVMSFSFSKMERVCSRLCSSHSQCSVISLRELPGEERKEAESER